MLYTDVTNKIIIIIVGVIGLGAFIYVYIGSGAQSEDVKQSKDG